MIRAGSLGRVRPLSAGSRVRRPIALVRNWLVVSLLALIVAGAWLLPWNLTPYGASGSPMAGFNGSHLAVVEGGINAYWNSYWRDPGLTLFDLRVVQGRVYGVEAHDRVVAVSAKDGRRLWTRRLGHRIAGPLIIERGRIALTIGTKTGWTLLVLATGSGRTLWRRPLAPQTKMVFTQDRLLTVSGPTIIERSMTTGRRLDQFRIPSLGLVQSVMVRADSVYVDQRRPAAESRVNWRSGRLLWIRRLPAGSRTGIAALSATRLYLPVLSLRSGTLALDAISLASGQVQWQRLLGVLPGPPGNGAQAGVAVLSDGTIDLASGLTNSLYAVDAATGNLGWENPLGQEPLTTTPVVVAGQVVVGDRTGMLWDVDQVDGLVEHQAKVSGTLFAEMPFLVGRSLYLATAGTGGGLWAIRMGRVVPTLAGGYRMAGAGNSMKRGQR